MKPMHQDHVMNPPTRLPVAPGGRDPLVVCVLAAADAIAANQRHHAQRAVHRLLAHTAAGSTAVHRVTRIIGQSLHARLAGDLSGSGNLYQEPPHPQDMLAAFQLLLDGTPFIRTGYTGANLTIMEVLGDAPRWHIVDIGIGSGTQWQHFLALLAGRGVSLPQVRLTGIDIPAPGPDPSHRLREVAARLQHHAAALGVPFSCEMLASPIEAVDVTALQPHATDALVINAAFALHHTAAGDGVVDPARSRDAVLRRLHGLQPRLLMLVEPDAEHNALPFVPRVREAMAHYLTVFDALNELLPGDRPARAVIEQAFFGREMLNIIAGEGPLRVERHERHTAWQRRLAIADFTAIDLGHLRSHLKRSLKLTPPCDLLGVSGGLALAWKGVPLVAVSAWKPQEQG
jgi:hypothetical protein